MNVLWIMVDQLRWDYLSCYGAAHMDTPNLDWLAGQGVRFNKAYVQSPICGPSRMSFYTGRYTRSHGSTANGAPLRVGEPTLGDHLREQGVHCGLVGKTHMAADLAGMQRLGIQPDSMIGALVSECGFEVFVRDDGENPTANPGRRSDDYEEFLRRNGMDGGENLWEEWANTGVTPDGRFVSGWMLENAPYPARVPKDFSETAWLTQRGIDFIESRQQAADPDQPWLCHLSYIKPHWPYLAPAPYHDMYSAKDLPPVNRSPAEQQTDHPLLQEWMAMRISKSFSRDEIRAKVGPVYMGLIKELDDQMGRLFGYLKETGRMKDTMIVFCSDHGDNMGDHWLGEKDMFYECSARMPLIIYDPRKQADATRGSVSDRLVEAIDLAPSFVEFFGGKVPPHILEGRSLLPILEGRKTGWRDFCVSEYDYATREPRVELGVDQADARLVMIYDGRWKLVHVEGMRPLLYDLQTDPQELQELGADPAYSAEIDRLQGLHFQWARRHHTRLTRDAETIDRLAARGAPPGVLIAYANRAEADEDGRIFPDHVES